MQSDVQKAIDLATKLHSGQFDKGGKPYIQHPLRLMSHAASEEEQIVAVLHDVLEDTPYTRKDLLHDGFSLEIVDAVDALTRRDDETYMEFIARLAQNKLARRVKILDIQDNMDLSRIPEPSAQDYSRLKRYEKALYFLLEDQEV